MQYGQQLFSWAVALLLPISSSVSAPPHGVSDGDGGGRGGQPVACPSSVVYNSSFVPHVPLATVVGDKVATTEDCIALCCNTANCSEWIHTTEYEDSFTVVPNNSEQRE